MRQSGLWLFEEVVLLGASLVVVTKTRALDVPSTGTAAGRSDRRH